MRMDTQHSLCLFLYLSLFFSFSFVLFSLSPVVSSLFFFFSLSLPFFLVLSLAFDSLSLFFFVLSPAFDFLFFSFVRARLSLLPKSSFTQKESSPPYLRLTISAFSSSSHQFPPYFSLSFILIYNHRSGMTLPHVAYVDTSHIGHVAPRDSQGRRHSLAPACGTQ